MHGAKRQANAFVGGAEIVVGVRKDRDQRKGQRCHANLDHVGLLKINWSVAARLGAAGKEAPMRSSTWAAAARQPVSLPPYIPSTRGLGSRSVLNMVSRDRS